MQGIFLGGTLAGEGRNVVSMSQKVLQITEYMLSNIAEYVHYCAQVDGGR